MSRTFVLTPFQWTPLRLADDWRAQEEHVGRRPPDYSSRAVTGTPRAGASGAARWPRCPTLELPRRMEQAGVPRSVAMKLTRHKTEGLYRRYAITSDADLRDTTRRLDTRTGTLSGIGGNGAR